MTRDPALWSIAIGGSLAIHVGLAAGLGLMPAYRPPSPFDATISIESLSRALADQVPVTAAASNISTAVLATTAAEPQNTLDASKDSLPAPNAVVEGTTAQTVRDADIAETVEIGPEAQTSTASRTNATPAAEISPALAPAQPKARTLATVAGVSAAAQTSAPTASPAPAAPAAAMAALRPRAAGSLVEPTADQSSSLVNTAVPATMLAPSSSAQATPETSASSSRYAETAPVAIGRVSTPPGSSGLASVADTRATATPVNSNPSVAIQGTAPAVSGSRVANPGSAAASVPAATSLRAILLPAASIAPTGATAAAIVGPTSAAPAAVTAVSAVAVASAPSATLAPVEQMVSAPTEDTGDAGSRLRSFVAGYRGGDCLLAVAGGGETAELDGYTDRTAELDRLTGEARQTEGIAVNARTHAVSAAQCGTLGLLRGLGETGTPELTIAVDNPTIGSGEVLTGAIGGFTQPERYLLVVDDEGKVQPVPRLTSLDDGSVRFSAPMTLTSGPVNTVQLLVALGSDRPLDGIVPGERQQAEASLRLLLEKAERMGARLEYGLSSFSVR
ncbi:MAG: hypothetical protein JNL61_13660 [Rhizobiaceae bacterium]|nr:hypothetical protein [Rhizobiaceae bacterium]